MYVLEIIKLVNSLMSRKSSLRKLVEEKQQ